MDERVEAFLADVMALEGEETNALRQGVSGALADYEQLGQLTHATRCAGVAWLTRYGCERERRPNST